MSPHSKTYKASKAVAAPRVPNMGRSSKVHKVKSDKDKIVHKRSRLGCFTCRLRRKKCNERRPHCHHCTILGLNCWWETPAWWSSKPAREQVKEHIKETIKRNKDEQRPAKSVKARGPATTLSSSSSRVSSFSAASFPALAPGLPFRPVHADFVGPYSITPECYPTPDESSTSEYDPADDHCCNQPFPPAAAQYTEPRIANTDRDLPYVWSHNDAMLNGFDDFDDFGALDHDFKPMYHDHDGYGQADTSLALLMEQENCIILDDGSMRKSNKSAAMFMHTEHPSDPLTGEYLSENVFDDEMLHSHINAIGTDGHPLEYLDDQLQGRPAGSVSELVLDKLDQPFLDHLLSKVKIFPIADMVTGTPSMSDWVFLALSSNNILLSNALGFSAMHKKAISNTAAGYFDSDILRLRGKGLRAIMGDFEEPSKTGDVVQTVVLSMLFGTIISSCHDEVPDLTWEMHLNTIRKFLDKDFHARLSSLAYGVALHEQAAISMHDMTLVSWIDIIGSTLILKRPTYFPNYQASRIFGTGNELEQMMGCNDTLMYIIAEIAMLDADKAEGLVTEEQLCERVQAAGALLDEWEQSALPVGGVLDATQRIIPLQLTANITELYRLAARVYLCSVLADCGPWLPQYIDFVNQFSVALQTIPVDAGLDCFFAWPLMVVGSVAPQSSVFREIFIDRYESIGQAASIGALWKVKEILLEVWRCNDESLWQSDSNGTHWREVMQRRGWSSALIL